LQAVTDSEGVARADVLDYSKAMTLCARVRRANAVEAAEPLSFKEFKAVKDQWLAEPLPEEHPAEGATA
jgi:hypothetical protein